MNKNTICFSHIKGKILAVCDVPRIGLVENKEYNIEFEPDRTFEGEKYVTVYDGETMICRCSCERFTLSIQKDLVKFMNACENVYVCTRCEKSLPLLHVNNGSKESDDIGACVICGISTYNTISKTK